MRTKACFSCPAIVRDESILQRFETDFNEVMPDFLQMDSSLEASKVKSIMSKVRDFYFGPGERIDTIEKIMNYSNVMTG
jgi:hypothetical protein